MRAAQKSRTPARRKTPAQRKIDRASSAAAAERLHRSEARVRQFVAAYAAYGILVDDASIAGIAAQEPLNLNSTWTLDPDEELE